MAHRTAGIEQDGTITTWTYDAAYQLINEQRNGPPGTISFSITYTYPNLRTDSKNPGIFRGHSALLTWHRGFAFAKPCSADLPS